MKLSRNMKRELDGIPDEGEALICYESQAAPLLARGLVTIDRRIELVPRRRLYLRLTAKGRAVKHRNEA